MYQKAFIAGLVLSAVLAMASCRPEEAEQEPTGPASEVSFQLELLPGLDGAQASGSYQGKVVVDGNSASPHPLDMDWDNNTCSAEIQLSQGYHKLTLVFFYMYNDTEVVLASQSQFVEVVVGETTSANYTQNEYAYPDYDSDNLNNMGELEYSTDPFDPDTDDDDLTDGGEVHNYGTDPLNPDTDGDGIMDGDEVGCEDADGDGYYGAFGCGTTVDCDDADENTWDTCATCKDYDSDTYFELCNRYIGINGPDCDDADPNNWVSCADCQDNDGDGWYGEDGSPGNTCDAYVTINGPDCNDGNSTVYPGAPELCDGIDNQCPGDPGYGDVDEGCATCTDADGDGYYAESGCGTDVDCDDGDSTVYPGAPELCDGVDNQCPGDASYGDVDEGCGINHYWTKRFGGSYGDLAISIYLDGSGNIYIQGRMNGTVDFGEDFGTSDQKTSAGGNRDIFVTRLNSDASYGWTKRIGRGGSGSDNEDSAEDLFADANGVYLGGCFDGTVNFAEDFGGSDSKSCSGGSDIFFTKILPGGGYGWTTAIGGGLYERGYAVCAHGNTVLGTGHDDGSSYVDVFIRYMDVSSGAVNDVNWLNSPNDSWDHGTAIMTDSAGNIYVAGQFKQSMNFAGAWGQTDNKTSAGDADAFITKINSDDSYAWTRRIGGSANEVTEEISISDNGKVCITGYFDSASLDFAADFGGSDVKTNQGLRDIFVTCINQDGSYIWTRVIGGNSSETAKGIAFDQYDNVYVGGYFRGDVDFGADFGVSDVKNWQGLNDLFLTRIEVDGSYGWTKVIQTPENVYANDIFIDNSDNLYMVGGFDGTVDFGAPFGTSYQVTSAGDRDAFITKIGL